MKASLEKALFREAWEGQYDLSLERESLEFLSTIGDAHVTFLVSHRIMSRILPITHHHGDYELLYVMEGSGVQRIGKERYPFGTGDMILVHPGEEHIAESDKGTVRCSFRFFFRQKPASKAETVAEEALLRLLERVRTLHDKDGELRPFLLEIQRELTEKQVGYKDRLPALCVLVFTAFLRMAGEVDPRIFASERMKNIGYFRERIEQFINNHYKEKISVKDMAERLHLSVRQTSRLVQKAMGRSFVEAVNETRVNAAKAKIAEGDARLSEVATACGFPSYSHFVSCFSARVGISPTAYIRSLKQQPKQREG
ncbi:MAG: helix-turn-helix domain-containing protein [Clostridia bacterium]|nr:helix-turn-helix domain-containing protein [Clostridia bacterium]